MKDEGGNDERNSSTHECFYFILHPSAFILAVTTARLHFGASASTVSIIASEPARL
jgi:hypothetical protein